MVATVTAYDYQDHISKIVHYINFIWLATYSIFLRTPKNSKVFTYYRHLFGIGSSFFSKNLLLALCFTTISLLSKLNQAAHNKHVCLLTTANGDVG